MTAPNGIGVGADGKTAAGDRLHRITLWPGLAPRRSVGARLMHAELVGIVVAVAGIVMAVLAMRGCR